MKKKILVLTLATMLALGGCGNAQSGNSAAASEQAAQTEAAEKATEASVSATVKATATPKPTVTPKETTAPKQNATATAAPVATATPQTATTAAPAATAAPKTATTAAPVATVTPQAATTAAPAATAAPQAATTAAPVTTAAPQATQTPAATPKATATSAPAAHSCTWDNGSVTTAATCAGEGVMTYTCTGCGATRTESIGRTDHNYVTETTQATCTTGGGSRTYCTVCGEVQSETHTEGGAGHSFEKHYALGIEPSCRGAASYIMICSSCGAHGETGTDPATEHVYNTEVLLDGDCSSATQVRHVCSVCGHEYLESYTTDEHDFQEDSYSTFNEETLEWETHAIIRCTRCGLPQ